MIKVLFGMILGTAITLGVCSTHPKILDGALEICYMIEAKVRG